MSYRAYKAELQPNNKQITFFKKCVGTARWVYNWALDKRKSFYETNQTSLSHNETKKLLNQEKKYITWLKDVPKSIHRGAMENLDNAYQKFFKKHTGFPKFKSKHSSRKSFLLEQEQFKVEGNRIFVARLGWVMLKESDYIPVTGVKYVSATISCKADKWFISVTINDLKEEPDLITEGDVIGIDLGIKTLAVCSNGMSFENPKAYKKHLAHLKHLQREVNRRLKGSKNREKSKKKVSKQYYKISCIRHDSIHKMTSALVKTKPKVIIIEDLNVEGMLKNHKLAQALSDVAFGEIRRQLEYKCKLTGTELFVFDRFFPSSKMCNNCGCIFEGQTLNDRIYKCSCGYEQDRDVNASYNIRDYYLKSLP